MLQRTLDSRRRLPDQHHRLIQVVPVGSVKAENMSHLASARVAVELLHCRMAVARLDLDSHSAEGSFLAGFGESSHSAETLDSRVLFVVHHTPVAGSKRVCFAADVARRPLVSAEEVGGRLAAGEGTQLRPGWAATGIHNQYISISSCS